MELHQNARSCPKSRALLVHRVRCRGWTVKSAAEAAGISERSAYRWLARFRREGRRGLHDRSSRPRRSPRRTAIEVVRKILALRLKRWPLGDIAEEVGVSLSTAARVARRAGMAQLSSLDPVEPPNRYEREAPGELIHIDIKMLGRIDGVGHRITGDRTHRPKAGWEYLHICIDDYTRVAYAEILPTKKTVHAEKFLRRATDWLAQIGVTAQRLLTDNDGTYRSPRFTQLCSELEIGKRWTRPYRPRTNGKAERFIQTLLREWAYRYAYQSSAHRRANLPRYLAFYNSLRPHTSLQRQPPISRLDLNNLLAIHN